MSLAMSRTSGNGRFRWHIRRARHVCKCVFPVRAAADCGWLGASTMPMMWTVYFRHTIRAECQYHMVRIRHSSTVATIRRAHPMARSVRWRFGAVSAADSWATTGHVRWQHRRRFPNDRFPLCKNSISLDPVRRCSRNQFWPVVLPRRMCAAIFLQTIWIANPRDTCLRMTSWRIRSRRLCPMPVMMSPMMLMWAMLWSSMATVIECPLDWPFRWCDCRLHLYQKMWWAKRMHYARMSSL